MKLQKYTFLLLAAASFQFLLAGCNDVETVKFSSIMTRPLDDISYIRVGYSPYSSTVQHIKKEEYDDFFEYVDVDYYWKEYEELSYNYVDYMFEIIFVSTSTNYEKIEIDLLTNRHLYIQRTKHAVESGAWNNSVTSYISAEPVSSLFTTETSCFFWCHLI